MRVSSHASKTTSAGPTDDKQAALRANQKANKDAYHEAYRTASYMAHQGDGRHSHQGSEALSAISGKPRLHSGATQSWPRDNKEVQRANWKADNVANNKANRKANYKVDLGRKAKTPDDVQEADGAQGELGLDGELNEAKKAQDNSNDYADKDSALGMARTTSGSIPLPLEI
jgi:hypothetical protein